MFFTRILTDVHIHVPRTFSYLADSQRLTGYLVDPKGLPVQLDPASMPSCSLHGARTDNTLVASSSRLLDNPLLGLSILHAAGLSGSSSSPGMRSLQEAHYAHETHRGRARLYSRLPRGSPSTRGAPPRAPRHPPCLVDQY